jgi:hypothetical protein
MIVVVFVVVETTVIELCPVAVCPFCLAQSHCIVAAVGSQSIWHESNRWWVQVAHDRLSSIDHGDYSAVVGGFSSVCAFTK